MRIAVRNRQRAVAVDARRLTRFAMAAAPRCLERPGRSGAPLQSLEEVEVTILSDAAIARVHEQFMQISGPTDVITFDHGEILIGAQTAAANAKDYGVQLEKELELYIIHGLLHLNGFEDQTEAGALQMAAIQQEILAATTAGAA